MQKDSTEYWKNQAETYRRDSMECVIKQSIEGTLTAFREAAKQAKTDEEFLRGPVVIGKNDKKSCESLFFTFIAVFTQMTEEEVQFMVKCASTYFGREVNRIRSLNFAIRAQFIWQKYNSDLDHNPSIREVITQFGYWAEENL